MMIEKTEKTIVCQPIDDYAAKMLGEGFYFSVSITTDYDGGRKETRGTEWFIHPNGTFSGKDFIQFPNEPPEDVFDFDGTFEKSKYNDYVKQMQELKEGWTEELDYNEHDVNEYDEELRRKILSTISFPIYEWDESEMPF